MSFSFSEGLERDLDYCRFRLDDVSDDDPRCSDELINACISKYGVDGALVELCNRIMLFYAKEPDKVGFAGGRLVSFKSQYEAYRQLYEDLVGEFQAVQAGEALSGGGIRSGLLDFSQEVYEDYLPMRGIDNQPRGYDDSPERFGVPFGLYR